jgi:hypothetical protein
MPKELKKKLRKRARAKGLKGEAIDDYVYGTLENIKKKKKKPRKRT